MHIQYPNAYPMKNPSEILTDIIGFRSDLRSLHESRHTCNQLRTYISKITHYMRINDVDLDRPHPFVPLIEKEIEYIKPHIPYDIKRAERSYAAGSITALIEPLERGSRQSAP